MDRFDTVKLQIKDRVDLVELVGEYVHLKAKGRYHVGLCPFHQEKTPSFTVKSDTQHFKCYGCGKTGDVFTFVQERDGLDFKAALQLLADRAGVSTEGVFGGGRRGESRQDAHATLAKVAEWFQEQLRSGEGEAAREYLAGRGLTAGVAEFGLGYHPRGGRLLRFAKEAGLPRDLLDQAGLLGDDGYERFAGRLMFPIVDERGRTVGFGGRVLEADAERAKYVNSPESPFFNKRRLLFGLRQVKQAGERQLVVMEGYTDVIAAHLAGLRGAVATLGTSLTTDHARLLERYATDGVTLLFDGDRAGRQAADRAFRELVHTRLPVRIALLDEGTDPADMVSELPGKPPGEVAAGRERLRQLLAAADDAVTVWFRLLRRAMDLTLDVQVERAAAECHRILQTVADPARRVALGRRMAQHLGVPEPAFLRAVSRGKAVPARTGRSGGGASEDDAASDAPAAPGPRAIDPALVDSDRCLLACLLAAPELCRDGVGTDVMVPEIGEILALLREGVAAGSGSGARIVQYLFMRCT